MRNCRLTIRLSNQLRSDLAAIAKATGKCESEIIREAIEEYCRRHARNPTAYEVAQKSGLIGCVESGLGDLSTNKKYMEGFGYDR